MSVLELFGNSTQQTNIDWQQVVETQHCPYLNRKCVKVRKSQPEISIGTCSVNHRTQNSQGVIICPHRLLERRQIFMDCIHLLTLHEPGNELHRVGEIAIPGGNVDYFLVSVRNGTVVDFVGIELQAVDTTGTVWPQRQAFLRSVGISAPLSSDVARPYGMNWKMTAKTTLVQLHHKVETFERLNKHMVLVLQDGLMDYMRAGFNFAHVEAPKLGDAMQFHVYSLQNAESQYRIQLASRWSTTAAGIARCLGLQASPKVELEVIIAGLQSKISSQTLFTL